MVFYKEVRMKSKTGAMCGIAGLLLIGVSGFADQVIVAGWKIGAGDNGKTLVMTYDDPATYLNIEQQLRFEINNQFAIQSGTVKFRNGVERALGEKEAQSYFNGLKGEHTLWEYYLSRGNVALFTPAAGIPNSCFGKRARVFTNNDAELFGNLLKSSDASELFLLEREGACCGPIHFSVSGVREVQEIK